MPGKHEIKKLQKNSSGHLQNIQNEKYRYVYRKL